MRRGKNTHWRVGPVGPHDTQTIVCTHVFLFGAHKFIYANQFIVGGELGDRPLTDNNLQTLMLYSMIQLMGMSSTIN